MQGARWGEGRGIRGLGEGNSLCKGLGSEKGKGLGVLEEVRGERSGLQKGSDGGWGGARLAMSPWGGRQGQSVQSFEGHRQGRLSGQVCKELLCGFTPERDIVL